MTEPVKKRTYDSAIRREQAARTRARILDAAATLFATQGYAGTSVRAIAESAGVAPDTVYATFGTKVRLLTAIIDTRLAPAGERNVMDRPAAHAVRDAPDQRAQLRAFARDMAAVSARVRPIYEVLRAASTSEPEVAEVFAEMERHRFENMARLVAWLSERGALRTDPVRAAETIWALAGADVARMLCDVRGWTDDEYATWLESTLADALLPVEGDPAH
jgi:AcrR family transcriptional regulator